MPNSNYPDCNVWLDALKHIKNQLSYDSIVVGHSMGCLAACQFLVEYNIEVSKLILVAPTHPKMDWSLIERTHSNKRQVESIKNFTNKFIDWGELQKLVKDIVIILSEDDPYIPVNVRNLFEKNIEARYKIFQDKGHFNMSTVEMIEFPELLDEIINK